MPIKIAHSTKEMSAAVTDLKQQCGETEPRAVLCFSSTRYDPATLSRELAAAFPAACVFGCSTAGELISGRMLNGSVVAMFLDGDAIASAACGIVRDVNDVGGVRDALRQLEAQAGRPLAELDPARHVGLVLIDGMSRAEEQVIETLGDLTDVPFIGGSAGDDLQFRATHVFAGGEAYTNAAVLVLLEPRRGFDFLKTQSFVPTGRTLVATEVDEPNRKVLRFNGKPALAAYAEAIGVSVDEAPAHFVKHPLGLMAGDEPFVRSPQRAEGDSLVFYCQIMEDLELEVLDGTDIVSDTRAALQAKIAELGKVAAVIDFNCILRTLQLRAEGRDREYGEIFQSVPAVGFSTYGEAYLGHINQTSTMLVLK